MGGERGEEGVGSGGRGRGWQGVLGQTRWRKQRWSGGGVSGAVHGAVANCSSDVMLLAPARVRWDSSECRRTYPGREGRCTGDARVGSCALLCCRIHDFRRSAFSSITENPSWEPAVASDGAFGCAVAHSLVFWRLLDRAGPVERDSKHSADSPCRWRATVPRHGHGKTKGRELSAGTPTFKLCCMPSRSTVASKDLDSLHLLSKRQVPVSGKRLGQPRGQDAQRQKTTGAEQPK